MKACFNGCSFTEGLGFAEVDRNRHIYDRLICNHFQWKRTNIAVEGSSNTTIFHRSAEAIISNNYDIIFTQWSALNRQWFFPGPDCKYSNIDGKHPEFAYRYIHLDKKFDKKFKETLRIFNHDFHKIIELVSYVKILDSLAKAHNVITVNINGLVSWQEDLTTPLDHQNLDACLSTYTKKILDFENRNDDEIIHFFRILQQKFKEMRLDSWVNLFDSMQKMCIDTGPQGHHPGPESHRLIAEKTIEFLEKHL